MKNWRQKSADRLTGNEDADWTLDTKGHTAGVDFQAHTAYAPTDSSDHAAYERLVANATVATSTDYSSLTTDKGIPPQFVQTVDRHRIQAMLDGSQRAAHEGYYGDSDEDTWEDPDRNFNGDFSPPEQLPPGSLDFHLKSGNILGYYDALTKALTPGASYSDAQQYWTHQQALQANPPEDKIQRIADIAREAVGVANRYINVEGESGSVLEDRLDTIRDSYTTHQAAEAAWRVLKRAFDSPKSETNVEFIKENDGDTPDRDGEGDRWCDVVVLQPPLSMPLKGGLRTRKWRQTDAGAYIRRPERELTDGRVFGHARKRPNGGSVVIDTSGSMHLVLEQVEQIMEMAPGVNIATYCSDGSETGYLTIAARNNKRVSRDDLKPDCYGNGIDGPALRWLAAQTAPRVWVSDAGVTGRWDNCSEDLLQECEDLCYRYGITRYHSMDALIAARARGEL
jgi:hypothetical protein